MAAVGTGGWSPGGENLRKLAFDSSHEQLRLLSARSFRSWPSCVHRTAGADGAYVILPRIQEFKGDQHTVLMKTGDALPGDLGAAQQALFEDELFVGRVG